MHLEIITPDKKVFAGEANSVTLPGSEGQFQVLNHHAALVSALKRGDLVIEVSGVKQSITIDGGVVEVLNNNVLVLAEAVL